MASVTRVLNRSALVDPWTALLGLASAVQEMVAGVTFVGVPTFTASWHAQRQRPGESGTAGADVGLNQTARRELGYEPILAMDKGLAKMAREPAP